MDEVEYVQFAEAIREFHVSKRAFVPIVEREEVGINASGEYLVSDLDALFFRSSSDLLLDETLAADIQEADWSSISGTVKSSLIEKNLTASRSNVVRVVEAILAGVTANIVFEQLKRFGSPMNSDQIEQVETNLYGGFSDLPEVQQLVQRLVQDDDLQRYDKNQLLSYESLIGESLNTLGFNLHRLLLAKDAHSVSDLASGPELAVFQAAALYTMNCVIALAAIRIELRYRFKR